MPLSSATKASAFSSPNLLDCFGRKTWGEISEYKSEVTAFSNFLERWQRSSRKRRRRVVLCFYVSVKMEREQRKGLVAEEMKNGRKKKRDENKKEEEPTDEEVDEFFRILKRMHVAIEYFGGVKSKSLSSQRWSSESMADGKQGPEEEDEEDDNDQGEREKLEEIYQKEKKKIKSGQGTLDLNADPK